MDYDEIGSTLLLVCYIILKNETNFSVEL